MHSVRRQISPYASQLWRDQTDAENLIWQALRNRQNADFKFRFQATVGPCAADFLYIEMMLIARAQEKKKTLTRPSPAKAGEG